MKLRDRVAIITGGGTGIGRGIAKAFAREGARLVLAQDRLEKARVTAEELQASGCAATALRCDVSSRRDVQALVSDTMQRFGTIDILVNNAAVTGAAALWNSLDCTDDTWDYIMAVNLRGPFMCSQEVARHMVGRKNGVILNISSVAAFAAQPMAAGYCAAKAGLVALTKVMALELARYGIRVNAIAPGDVVVEEGKQVLQRISELRIDPAYIRKTPLDRPGLPEEVGNAAVFLASDDATFVHGTTLIVDGGYLIY